MTRGEWEGIAALLDNAWRGGMDEARSSAYFALLSHYPGSTVMAALKRLLATGSPFVPTASEIVQAVNANEGSKLPEFDEAWRVIERAKKAHWDSESKGIALIAEQASPEVAGWVSSYGWRRLLLEPVAHEDFGGAVLKRLREEFTERMATKESRDRLRLALNPRGGGQLRRLASVAQLKAVQ